METTEKKFANGLFAYENTELDWLPMRLSINVEEFIKTLETYKSIAIGNNGKLNIDVKRSSKDRTKLYTEVNSYQKPKEVTTSEHSPDRSENIDLPF